MTRDEFYRDADPDSRGPLRTYGVVPSFSRTSARVRCLAPGRHHLTRRLIHSDRSTPWGH